MNFDLPSEITDLVTRLDTFIEAEIVPLQAEDDNERFFDHRREYARTDFDNGGLPRPEWEALMAEAVHRADKAGLYRIWPPRGWGCSTTCSQSIR
jgi:acyl-CoA dehydrogenase